MLALSYIYIIYIVCDVIIAHAISADAQIHIYVQTDTENAK